ncbi:hypothetical protein C8R45DRAFT_1179973 [Mycena sanguinolenta]|nr:hypothetical protein C8R45DRAFT_1179973 [Mycena sanguinolenta]
MIFDMHAREAVYKRFEGGRGGLGADNHGNVPVGDGGDGMSPDLDFNTRGQDGSSGGGGGDSPGNGPRNESNFNVINYYTIGGGMGGPGGNNYGNGSGGAGGTGMGPNFNFTTYTENVVMNMSDGTNDHPLPPNGATDSHSHSARYNIHHLAERGFDILHRSVVFAALHDSVESFSQPKCHPRTREDLLRALRDWEFDSSRDIDLVWLQGPAGAGKTAIMHTLATELHDAQRLGGCFFFEGDDATRGNAKAIIPTIAYQLALYIPALKPLISRIVDNNPSIVSRSLEAQMRDLIIGPCNSLGSHENSDPVTVHLDGLDLCEGPLIQQEILRVIGSCILQNNAARIRLRFIIASRPEAHLRALFLSLPYSRFCHELPVPKSFGDVHTYLTDEFDRIHRTHPTLARIKKWPRAGTVADLVQKSSGYFIYPSAILKFISDEFARPAERLVKITELMWNDYSIPSNSASQDQDEDMTDSDASEGEEEAMPDSEPASHSQDVMHSQSASQYFQSQDDDMTASQLAMEQPDRKSFDSQLPFEPLDQFYLNILRNAAPRQTQLIQILCVIANFKLDASGTDRALGYKPGDTQLTLRGLHSMLQVPDDDHFEDDDEHDDAIFLHHASFLDFLKTPSRSYEFCVSTPQHEMALARSILELFAREHQHWTSWGRGYVESSAKTASLTSCKRCLSQDWIEFITTLPRSDCDELQPLIQAIKPDWIFNQHAQPKDMVSFLKRMSSVPRQLIGLWEDYEYMFSFQTSVELLGDHPSHTRERRTLHPELIRTVLPMAMVYARLPRVRRLLDIEWGEVRNFICTLRNSDSGDVPKLAYDWLQDTPGDWTLREAAARDIVSRYIPQSIKRAINGIEPPEAEYSLWDLAYLVRFSPPCPTIREKLRLITRHWCSLHRIPENCSCIMFLNGLSPSRMRTWNSWSSGRRE